MKTVRLLLLADTHGRHREVDLEGALSKYKFDVLVHAGDICLSVGLTTATVLQRNVEQIMDFCYWTTTLPIEHKVVIGGNHDFALQHLPETHGVFARSGVTYLENQSAIVAGLKFTGSPWTPWFGGMAFNYEPEDGASLWSHIPEDTDVLVTHGPPKGILDVVYRQAFGKRIRTHTGCPHLRERVEQIKPKVHLFGHIHASRGSKGVDGTDFYNAAVVDHRYRVVHKPMIAELEVEE